MEMGLWRWDYGDEIELTQPHLNSLKLTQLKKFISSQVCSTYFKSTQLMSTQLNSLTCL